MSSQRVRSQAWWRKLARSIGRIPRRVAARVGIGRRPHDDALPVRLKPFGLRRREVCHYAGRASWYELHPRRKRKGKMAPQITDSENEILPIPRQALAHTDVGILILTSERIIFDGLQGEKRVSFASLEGITAFKDGVRLEGAIRRNPFIAIDDNVEEAIEVLHALLARQSRKTST